MKRVISTTAILVLSFASFSQSKKNSCSFSFGSPIPVGAFGKSSFSSVNDGFAKIGIKGAFSYERKIKHSFAISSLVYAQLNPINTGALQNGFSDRRYSITLNPLESISITNWNFEKKNWLNVGLLIGGTNEFSIDKKKGNLFFNVKTLVGINYCMSPKIIGKSDANNTKAYYEQTSSSSLGLAYLFSKRKMFFF